MCSLCSVFFVIQFSNIREYWKSYYCKFFSIIGLSIFVKLHSREKIILEAKSHLRFTKLTFPSLNFAFYLLYRKCNTSIRKGTTSNRKCTTNKMSRLVTKPTNDCAPSEDSDQPGHPPSLIRVFAVRLMGS